MAALVAPSSPSHLPRPTTLLRGFYFLNYGGLGALAPFLPLLLAARQLSATEISWVMVVSPLFSLLMPPIWGTLADALQARLMLLRISAFGTGLSVLSLLPEWHFWGNLLGVVLMSLFRGPLPSLVDSVTYAALGPQGASYGRIRVWGSAGFGLAALLVGQLGGSLHPRRFLAVAALIYIGSGLFTLGLPAAAPRRQRGVLGEALCWLRQPVVLLLLCGNVAYYFAHAILDAFVSLHLRELRFDDSVVSLAWVIGVTAEVLVMLAAPSLLVGRSSPPLLCACSVVAAARWSLLARWRRRGPILALQSLHGITFGLWYLALVHYVQTHAPGRLRTTLQASSHASVALGAVSGYLLGGRAFERAAGPAAFGLATRGSLVALVCYGLMLVVGRAPARSAC